MLLTPFYTKLFIAEININYILKMPSSWFTFSSAPYVPNLSLLQSNSGPMLPFAILDPQAHFQSLLPPQPLTPGKWLWWKATQKPSSIYTLYFLTECSQAVTCAIETTGMSPPCFFFLLFFFPPMLQ